MTAAGVLSGSALLLVTGRYSNDGPTVAEVSPGRGWHVGDFFILAGWAAGMLAIVLPAVLRRPDG